MIYVLAVSGHISSDDRQWTKIKYGPKATWLYFETESGIDFSSRFEGPWENDKICNFLSSKFLLSIHIYSSKVSRLFSRTIESFILIITLLNSESLPLLFLYEFFKVDYIQFSPLYSAFLTTDPSSSGVIFFRLIPIGSMWPFSFTYQTQTSTSL